jgi:hypothetical protein
MAWRPASVDLDTHIPPRLRFRYEQKNSTINFLARSEDVVGPEGGLDRWQVGNPVYGGKCSAAGKTNLT